MKGPSTDADTIAAAREKEKLLPWSALLCLVYSAVVGVFFLVGLAAGGPLKRFEKPDPQELWHAKTAVLLVFSAMCTELCFMISSSATVKVMGWNISTKLQVHTLGDSMLTLAEYFVKVMCGVYLHSFSGGIMHADQLAFGGPRPVYLARFVQWAFGVPILVLLCNRAFLSHCTTVEMMVRSLPSLTVCVVYIAAAWIMEVTPSHFVRWPLFFMSMSGQVVVMIDQAMLAYAHRHKPLFGLKISILIYEWVSFGFYALVFVLGRFGVLGSLTEQSIYAYCDATIKVFQGTLLAIVRHRHDLHTIKHWWVAAQAANQDFETLIQKASIPVIGLDLEGKVIFWNSSLESLTGRLQAEVKSKALVGIVAESCKEAVEAVISELISHAQEVSKQLETKTAKNLQPGSKDETGHITMWPKTNLVEITIPCKEGSNVRQLAMSFVPKSGQDGQLAGFMAIGQDLSEISELKFIQARKSALMAMLSHEIRSPLHGIMGLSGAMIESEACKPMHKQLGMIRACSERLLDLVTNIMFLAHQEKEKQANKVHVKPTDPVSFQLIVDEVMTLTKGAVDKSNRPLLKSTVKLVNELSCQRLPFVPGDKQKCTQLIYNLVTNACKFTDKGSITIGGRYVKDRQVLEVDVRDTGRGISAEGQKRIFQPFEQETNGDSRSFQGIGLGLSVCTEIASLHEGEIRLSSELGKGSCFTICLPCDGALGLADAVESSLDAIAPPTAPQGKAVPPQEAPAPAAGEPRGASKNGHIKVPTRSEMLGHQDPPLVLSVDDDEVNQEVVKNALKSFTQVEIAMDGQEALAFLKSRRDKKLPFPDIVLLDIQMPGMTGYEVCEQIRESFESAHAKLPVIMVSARTPYDKTAVEGYDTGMTDFLAKPFNSEILRRKVEIAMKVKEEGAMGASMVVLKEASQKVKDSTAKYEQMKEKAERLSKELDAIRLEDAQKSTEWDRAAKAEAEVVELKKKMEAMQKQEQGASQAEAEKTRAKVQELESQANFETVRAKAAERKLEELKLEVERLQRQPAVPAVASVLTQPAAADAALAASTAVAERAALARAELAEKQAQELKQQVDHLLMQQGASSQEAEFKAHLAEQLQKRVEDLLQQQDLSVSAVTKQADGRAREAEQRAQLAELRLQELQRQVQAQGTLGRPTPSWAKDSEGRAREAEAKAERLQKQLAEAETKAYMADQKAEQWQEHAQQVLQQVERPISVNGLSGGGGQMQRHLEAQMRNFVGAKAVVSLMSSRFQMMGKVAGQCRQLIGPNSLGDSQHRSGGSQVALDRPGWRRSLSPSGRVFERALSAQLSLLEQTAVQSEELAMLVTDDSGSLPNGHLDGVPWPPAEHTVPKLPGCMG